LMSDDKFNDPENDHKKTFIEFDRFSQQRLRKICSTHL
jgi:hypothetical protein